MEKRDILNILSCFKTKCSGFKENNFYKQQRHTLQLGVGTLKAQCLYSLLLKTKSMSQVLLTACLSRALFDDLQSKCSCFSLDLDAADLEIHRFLPSVILGQQKSHMSIQHQRTPLQRETTLKSCCLYHRMIIVALVC